MGSSGRMRVEGAVCRAVGGGVSFRLMLGCNCECMYAIEMFFYFFIFFDWSRDFMTSRFIWNCGAVLVG